jgi:hypothetical protein
VVTHIQQTLDIHFTGNFLPWHRWFTYSYEKALRDECGYRGYQPVRLPSQCHKTIWETNSLISTGTGRNTLLRLKTLPYSTAALPALVATAKASSTKALFSWLRMESALYQFHLELEVAS